MLVLAVELMSSYEFLSLCFQQVSPCLPVLSRLLFSSDSDLLADACWALSYLSDGPNEKIQAVIDSGVCRRLVELLMWVISGYKFPKLLQAQTKELPPYPKVWSHESAVSLGGQQGWVPCAGPLLMRSPSSAGIMITKWLLLPWELWETSSLGMTSRPR